MTTESWERMRQTWKRMRQTWKRMRQTWKRIRQSWERKKRKKTAEKGQILRKNDYLCKMKEKALTELSAPLEVEVTDLLWEDNID